MHNFASSLNPLYTAESAQFYSAFSPTTISLTPRFRWKRAVWLRFSAENAQNDPKTYSYEDSAKCNSAFSATTLSHASRFRRKRRVIKNFEYLYEFEEYFWKYWLDGVLYLLVTEICKKKVKNRIWKSRACRGLYIGKYPPPPLGGRKISGDVIWGKKYEKAKRKRGKM